MIAGRYRVLQRLGVGGMGEVLEVEHLALTGRRFALKVLSPELREAQELVERIRREARAAAAIHHPGIVAIHDVERDPRVGPIVVMERLYGASVGRVLRARGRITGAQARWVALAVLDALQAAHEAEIVHRDIKPANVFIEQKPDGSEVIRLLDFGVARDLRAPGITRPGHFLGTMFYAAPEQLQGTAPPGPETDLYALAATLVYAMAGFRLSVVDRVQGRSPDAELDRASLPAGWAAVLAPALCPAPQDRYPSARAMAEAIRGGVPEGRSGPLLVGVPFQSEAAEPEEDDRAQGVATAVLAAPAPRPRARPPHQETGESGATDPAVPNLAPLVKQPADPASTWRLPSPAMGPRPATGAPRPGFARSPEGIGGMPAGDEDTTSIDVDAPPPPEHPARAPRPRGVDLATAVMELDLAREFLDGGSLPPPEEEQPTIIASRPRELTDPDTTQVALWADMGGEGPPQGPTLLLPVDDLPPPRATPERNSVPASRGEWWLPIALMGLGLVSCLLFLLVWMLSQVL